MSYPHQRYLAQRPDGHTLDGTPGDCYRVCVAILLDVADPETLPHFVMYGARWWDTARRTVRETRPGWDLVYATPQTEGPFAPYLADPTEWAECQRLAIASGPSPRGPFSHCVVVDAVTGDLVWDPHPSGAGLAGPAEGLDLLVPEYDPVPAPRIALSRGRVTAVERVQAMAAAGDVRLCRQTKPLTEATAQVIADFADFLEAQPPRSTTPKETP